VGGGRCTYRAVLGAKKKINNGTGNPKKRLPYHVHGRITEQIKTTYYIKECSKSPRNVL